MILQIKSYKTINGKNQRVLLAFASLLLLLLLMPSFATFASLPSSASSSEPNAVPTYIYVANSGDNTVSVINGTTNTVVTTIHVGYDPFSVAFDGGTGWVYVANGGHPHGSDWNISVISPATNKVIKTFDTATGEIFDVGGKLWVTNPSPGIGLIRILSPKNGVILRTIYPCNCSLLTGLAYSPATNEVYVSTNGGNLSVINASTYSLTRTIHVPGGSVNGVAYDSANHDIYVSTGRYSVVVINEKDKIIANISVGSIPFGIAYDPSNHRIYVANAGSDSVSIISSRTNKVVATVAVGSFPEIVAYDHSNGEIYVTNSFSNTVSVIRGEINLTTITVRSGPIGVAAS